MEKKYQVVQRHYAGMIGVEFVVSSHSTTKAAWRAYHKYVNEAKRNRLYDVKYYVRDENDNDLIETKRKMPNGRWVTL